MPPVEVVAAPCASAACGFADGQPRPTGARLGVRAGRGRLMLQRLSSAKPQAAGTGVVVRLLLLRCSTTPARSRRPPALSATPEAPAIPGRRPPPLSRPPSSGGAGHWHGPSGPPR